MISLMDFILYVALYMVFTPFIFSVLNRKLNINLDSGELWRFIFNNTYKKVMIKKGVK